MIKFKEIDIQIEDTHTKKQIEQINILKQIEIARMNVELTEDLKKEIRELEKDNQFKYHYVYSYNLDTSMIDRVIHDNYSIYIGEGEKRRLFNEIRPFHSTEIYTELSNAGATITKKVEYIIKSKKDLDYNLGNLAQLIERNLIKGLSPIFSREHTNHKTTQLINDNNLYILLKNNEIVSAGVSVRVLEQSDIKKSSIHKLAQNTDLKIKNYKVIKSDNLDIEQKVFTNILIQNSIRLDWIEILDYFGVDYSEILKEI